MQKTTIIGLVSALAFSATTARAQTSSTTRTPPAAEPRIFAGINVGAQTQSRTLNADLTFPVYGQDATVSTSAGVDGGPIFDISGGYRLIKRFGVDIGAAVGFTNFSVTGRTSGAASIPSPSFFNHPASVTIPETDAKRAERSVYLALVAFYPVTEEIELAVFAGPSFIHIEQDLIGNFSVPAGTQDLNTGLNKESANGVGGIIGVDLNYAVTKQIGVGGFLRYNGGSADLPSAKNAKAGGFQLGVGVRLRY